MLARYMVVISVGLSGSAAYAGTSYFLVAERAEKVHGDSYVLPLSELADITAARKIVQDHKAGLDTPIVFAEVMAGNDGINRNILGEDRPLWSWHVSKFEGFGDMGIELTDGWPTYIETDVQGWLNNTGGGLVDDSQPPVNATHGHIGFWNYTVVAELVGPPTDLQLPATIPLPAAALCGAAMLPLVGIHWLRQRRTHG